MIDDDVPVAERYRQVGIHADQSPERIRLVRREVDRVFDQINGDIVQLVEWAIDARHSPESRQLAGVLAEALHESSAEARQYTAVDLRRIRAITRGFALNSRLWRCQFRYTSILDPDWRHALERPEPLAEEDVE
jgi:hypothetical protein